MQFLRSVFPIAALLHDFQTSSVHLLSCGRAFVIFHTKYYFVKNKRDVKPIINIIIIIIIYLLNQML